MGVLAGRREPHSTKIKVYVNVFHPASSNVMSSLPRIENPKEENIDQSDVKVLP